MLVSGGELFYLTDAQLVASPSRAAGVDEQTEFRLRVFGGDLIQAGSVLLKLCVASPLPACTLAPGTWRCIDPCACALVGVPRAGRKR